MILAFLRRLNELSRLRFVKCGQCGTSYLTRHYLLVGGKRVGDCGDCYQIAVGSALRRQRPKLQRVLLVDDDAHLRRAMASLLDRNEVSISEASDGLEALEVAQSQLPQVIVCDSSMKYGENLGERLRMLLPNSRIISFSGSLAERPWADVIIQKGSDGDLQRLERTIFEPRS